MLQVETATRQLPLQGVGALVQGLGLFAIFATLLGTCVNGQVAQRNVELAQQGQITDRFTKARFTKAIEQLGSERNGAPNLEVRLGGIYALERIAKDSMRDRAVVLEVLTTYVRENAPWRDDPPITSVAPVSNPFVNWRPRADIQAVLSVLGRRATREPLDLGRTDLRGADLHDAQLEGARFFNAHLEGADFTGAQLAGADFGRAHLERAHFEHAQVAGTRFEDAHLARADFEDADLGRAYFGGAHLERANFAYAQLERAYFQNAQLAGADFGDARLEDTYFLNARLERADFRMARSLTSEQLAAAAEGGRGALLPDYLR
jgi:uncharacterized protein YjbI with pentapeptide repeats